jgi:hypothetical protein
VHDRGRHDFIACCSPCRLNEKQQQKQNKDEARYGLLGAGGRRGQEKWRTTDNTSAANGKKSRVQYRNNIETQEPVWPAILFFYSLHINLTNVRHEASKGDEEKARQ